MEMCTFTVYSETWQTPQTIHINIIFSATARFAMTKFKWRTRFNTVCCVSGRLTAFSESFNNNLCIFCVYIGRTRNISRVAYWIRQRRQSPKSCQSRMYVEFSSCGIQAKCVGQFMLILCFNAFQCGVQSTRYGAKTSVTFVSATNKVYGCVVEMHDNLVRKSDGGFDVDEYLAHPDRYATIFPRKVRCFDVPFTFDSACCACSWLYINLCNLRVCTCSLS